MVNPTELPQAVPLNGAPLDGAVDDRCETGPLPALFARFQDELLGTLLCVVGNLEDARDALQETFIKCWLHQAQLPRIENPKAWIFRIALNAGHDVRSTAWRRKRVPLNGDATMLLATDTDHETTTGPGTRIEHEEEMARVRRAVAALRAEEQEVFLLRQNAQLSYDEIARTIEVPLGTVKSRMRAALAKLRTALVPLTDDDTKPG